MVLSLIFKHVYLLLKWCIFIWVTNIEANCPDGLQNPHTSDLQGNCYILHTNTRSDWEMADSYCDVTYNGSALMQTNTAGQIAIAEELLRVNNATEAWFGAREFLTGWMWQTQGGVYPVMYTNWAENSRSEDYSPEKVCAKMDKLSGFQWQKNLCTVLSFHICELGISNNNCRQDLNQEPVIIALRCFLIRNTTLSWSDARNQCIDLGGDLAVIDNSTVQSELESRFNQYDLPYYRGYWISLRQTTFYYSTGHLISNFPWKPNHPTRNTGLACVSVQREIRELEGTFTVFTEWNSNDCSRTLPFICQMGSDTSIRAEIVTIAPPTSGPGNSRPSSTNNPIVTSTTTLASRNPGDDTMINDDGKGDQAITGALIGVIVVVFAILGGLILMICFYTRRNKKIKKRLRENPEENNNYNNMEEDNNSNRNEPPERTTNLSVFTTSFTSSQRKKKQYSHSATREKQSHQTQSVSPYETTSVEHGAVSENGAYAKLNSREHKHQHTGEGYSTNNDHDMGNRTRYVNGSTRYESQRISRTKLPKVEENGENKSEKSSSLVRANSLPPLKKPRERSVKDDLIGAHDLEAPNNGTPSNETNLQPEQQGRNNEPHQSSHRHSRRKHRNPESSDREYEEELNGERRHRKRHSEKDHHRKRHGSIRSQSNETQAKSKHNGKKVDQQYTTSPDEINKQKKSTTRGSKREHKRYQAKGDFDNTEGLSGTYGGLNGNPNTEQNCPDIYPETYTNYLYNVPSSNQVRYNKGSKRSKAMRSPKEKSEEGSTGSSHTSANNPLATKPQTHEQHYHQHGMEYIEAQAMDNGEADNRQKKRKPKKNNKKDYDQTLALETFRSFELLDDDNDVLNRSANDAASLPDDEVMGNEFEC